jgi:hypothetical protein
VHSGIERNGLSDTKKALEWTINARVVLNQLSGVISKINRAWERFFSESDGDIGYFSDILVHRNRSRALFSLNVSKVAFETLETLKEKLDLLDKSCSTLAKTVSWNIYIYIYFQFLLFPSLGKKRLLIYTARTSVDPREQRSGTAK